VAERLLCISKEIWEEMLDVMEGVVGPGGGVEIQEVPDLEDLIEEEEDEQEQDRGCLQISQRRHPWWERDKWEDVWDEAKGWGDLGRNEQRELIKLKGR
jgi:hypothetical protein